MRGSLFAFLRQGGQHMQIWRAAQRRYHLIRKLVGVLRTDW